VNGGGVARLRDKLPDKLLNELPNDGSGPDLFRFPNASAFASNLALCPDREITGGKVALTRTRKLKSRAALALRLGAQALHHSATYFGDFFRSMRGKLGTPQAITATAHKLARIVYHMFRTGKAYDETVFAKKEQVHRARMEAKLKSQAKALASHSCRPQHRHPPD